MNTPASKLFDHLLNKLIGKKNDAAWSRKLEVAPPVISKIRNGKLEIGATLILRIHEEFDMSIAEIKELAGLPPANVRGAL